MKVTESRFTVETRNHAYQVHFSGESIEITYISSTAAIATIDNQNKQWKPCATHAVDLVRKFALGLEVKSPWSEKRVKSTKPILKIAE